ncbi:MAG: hypothetical protein ACRDV3_01850 [Acidothermaceae bacterium]
MRGGADTSRWADQIRAALAERAGGPRGTVSYDDAVALVCEATGWPVGHVWAQTATGWRSSGAWYAATGGSGDVADSLGALRETTAITDLGSGRGIVAAVLHLESCRFLPGLEGLGSPFRQAHAAALRLSGVVGVPVHSLVAGHRKVTAVLEFVTAGEVEPEGGLAESLLEVASRSRRRTARKPTPVKQPMPAQRSKSLDVEIPDNLAG